MFILTSQWVFLQTARGISGANFPGRRTWQGPRGESARREALEGHSHVRPPETAQGTLYYWGGGGGGQKA